MTPVQSVRVQPDDLTLTDHLCKDPTTELYSEFTWGQGGGWLDFTHIFFFFFFFFSACTCGILEVPRLGVKSELQLPAYATATAMRDP